MRSVIVASIASTAVLALVTPAAHAQTKVHLDPAGDMVQIDNEGEEIIPAPDETEGDIKRLVVEHQGTQVVVKATFKALHQPAASVLYYVPLKTNEGVKPYASLDTNPDNPQGELNFGGGSDCDGLVGKVSYSDDQVVFKIPRSCLSRPNWVKAGFGMARDSEDKGGLPISFIDDAMLDGEFGEHRPQLGPRVRHN